MSYFMVTVCTDLASRLRPKLQTKTSSLECACDNGSVTKLTVSVNLKW